MKLNKISNEDNKKDGQRGQVTIEFLLTIGVIISVILLFIATAVNISTGFLGHWVNYKSSRVYLVQDNGSNRESSLSFAKTLATQTFESSRFSNFVTQIESFQVNSDQTTPYSEYFGTILRFVPLYGDYGFFDIETSLQFLTESFLGKEPPVKECECRIKTAMGLSCQGAVPNGVPVTLFDNGC